MPAPSHAQLLYDMELTLQAIAADPANLQHHQHLRRLSLQYRAAGGKDLPRLSKMKTGELGETDRLLHLERLLAFDPGNQQHLLHLLMHLRTMAENDATGAYTPVLRWVHRLMRDSDAL